MRGVNKVIIIGRLGNDPEIRYTANGTAVGKFNVATNENWVNKEGNKEERTEWHRIVVWAKQAENCGEYLKKGRQVYVEGRLQTRSWEDKNGNKRWTTEIVANTVQFLGEPGVKPSTAPEIPNDYKNDEPTPSPAPSQEEQSIDPDSDIPF